MPLGPCSVSVCRKSGWRLLRGKPWCDGHAEIVAYVDRELVTTT